MKKYQKIDHRLLSFIVGCLLIAGNLFAQPPQRGGMQGPPPIPDSTQIVQMVDEMAESLSLTEEQKTQVSELHFAHFAEAKELMDAHKGDRENHRKAMAALRKDFEEQVTALLDDEQKDEFEKFMKDQRPPSRRQNQKR